VNTGDTFASIQDCVLCKIDYEAIAPFYKGEVYSTMKVAGVTIGQSVKIPSTIGKPFSTETAEKTTIYTYKNDTNDVWDELIIEYSKEYGIVAFELSSTIWR
jgi:hypothetical protein